MTAPDIDGSAAHAMRRALVLLLAVVAVLLIVAPAALATEEQASAPADERVTYQDLERQSSDRAKEFFPDPYQEPSFFQWILVPVMVGGLIVAIALLGAYLWWQPKFAAERRQKERR